MNRNGMKTFTFHTDDQISAFKPRGIDDLVHVLKRADSQGKKLIDIFKEVGDRLMPVLEEALLEVKPTRGFAVSHKPIYESKLEGVSVKTWQRTKTHTIKFSQKYKNIPVYGALVTLEVDDNYDLLAINSAFGDPSGIDASPKLKPEKLKELIQKLTKHDLGNLDLAASIYYYFDTKNKSWRLVYVVENPLQNTNALPKSESIPEMVDYIIDAHTGDLVSELPRVKTIK
jgi:Zn-dependent metalloprotease